MPTPDVLTLNRPEQLKALGHPLRLRVLEVLSESGEELTNRELAARLGVDPGHLHFHVKMLFTAGLIERVDSGRGREKPYRSVAAHVRVSPELVSSGAANETRAAMLDEVQRGWAANAGAGRFRAAQMTARLSEEDVRELYREFVEAATSREDPGREPLVITLFSYPRVGEAES
jgi:DNA-binding transcriptional ArsR family regulator